MRSAPVRVAELERILDPRLALAGEDRDQTYQRHHEEKRPLLLCRSERRQEADGRKERIDKVDRPDLLDDRLNPHPDAVERSYRGTPEVERELCGEGRPIKGPVRPRWIVR